MAQSIDFQQVIQHFVNVLTKQFLCWQGRMTKTDYIAFIIPALLVEYLLSWTGSVYLIFLIPTTCATIRRLHDLGMSGLVAILMIIPVVNIILTVYLCLQDGQKEKNDFGEAPTDACKLFTTK